jgi:coenzyme F420-0:L-glutamate ligase/coenzyme F420-1:gamma-L-glutamate ligase
MTDSQGFWDVIEGRRSVRQFAERPVERGLIERMLAAGAMAPNAHNTQSWRFVVLTDKPAMTAVVDRMNPRYQQALLESGLDAAEAAVLAEKRRTRLTCAPVVVIVCVAQGDLKAYIDATRSQGEVQMAIQSAALAAGNILLAAHALGLGGVWMCAPMFAPGEVREELDLPADWEAQAMLLLGYPADEPAGRPRRPMEEVVAWR